MLYIHLLFYIPFMKRGIINNIICKSNYNMYNINENSYTYSNELPIYNTNILTSNLSLLIDYVKNKNSTCVNKRNSISGYDNKYIYNNDSNNFSENMNMNINNSVYKFIINNKKKNILELLESNNTCINTKLNLIDNLYNFQEKSMYTPCILNGGFWKDCDFTFT